MKSSVAWKQNPEMITRTIDGQAVILAPQEGLVLTLNEVGTLIWEMAEGSSTQEDILAAICREFEVGSEQAMSDIEEFAATLEKKGLLLRIKSQ